MKNLRISPGFTHLRVRESLSMAQLHIANIIDTWEAAARRSRALEGFIGLLLQPTSNHHCLSSSVKLNTRAPMRGSLLALPLPITLKVLQPVINEPVMQIFANRRCFLVPLQITQVPWLTELWSSHLWFGGYWQGSLTEWLSQILR
jgi:hypothetical protein